MRTKNLEESVDLLIKPETFREKIIELAKTSKGYKEVWLKFIDFLKQNQDDLTPGKKHLLAELLKYLESAVADARKKILSLGITIEHPIDRAFEIAFEISKGDGHTDVNAFLQVVYDHSENAADAIRKLTEILNSIGTEEAVYCASALKAIRRSDAAKRLRHRGVKLKDSQEVLKKTSITKQKINSHQSRAIGLKRYAKMSVIEREAWRIDQAEKKEWIYAGRRKDLQDADGHHPFFGSIYAANYARLLDRKGKPWLYCPHAFFTKVPKTEERITQKSLMVEPEFYLPQENRYLLLIPDRRFINNGFHQSSLPEQISRAHVAMELLNELNLDMVHADELKTAERLPEAEVISISIRKGKKTKRIPGNNIHTNPDEFKLKECPCPQCKK